MRVTLYNWAGERAVTEVFEELGLKHNEIVNPKLYDSYHELVDLFVEQDLSVMVKPHVHKRKKGEPRNQPLPEKEMSIFVDTRTFGQR